jgi:hypothetical protein
MLELVEKTGEHIHRLGNMAEDAQVDTIAICDGRHWDCTNL